MDLDLIRREGELGKAAAKRVWWHANTENLADIDAIMATVTGGDGEVTYALPYPGPNGELTVPCGTTLKDAEDHYRSNYKIFRMVKWEAFIELRKPWYVFFEGVNNYIDLATGDPVAGHSIAFFQLSDDDSEGIQGEMAWSRYPLFPGYISRPGDDHRGHGPESVPLTKASNLAMFYRYMAGLREGDIDAVLATMAQEPHCAIRNYSDDGGPQFISLVGPDAVRDYLSRFNDKYIVDELDVANILTAEWYVFAELRWVVRERHGDPRPLTFHTAEFFPITEQTRFVSRIGFGTPFL